MKRLCRYQIAMLAVLCACDRDSSGNDADNLADAAEDAGRDNSGMSDAA